MSIREQIKEIVEKRKEQGLTVDSITMDEKIMQRLQKEIFVETGVEIHHSIKLYGASIIVSDTYSNSSYIRYEEKVYL